MNGDLVMNFAEIKKMVKSDMNFDETELDTESLKTPQIHNKYLVLYTDEKLLLTKLESELKELIRYKWLYYTGKMSENELEQFGWEPFQLSILKTDIDKFVSSDKEIIELENKIAFQKEKTNYLESVIKIVSSRQWMIKSAIEWIKFTQGV